MRRGQETAMPVRERRRQRNRRPTVTQRRGSPVGRSSTRATIRRPHPRFGWYTGLAVMAVLEVIEWPLAIVMVLCHEMTHRAHNEALRDLAATAETGASTSP